jgi:hypothetical protein
MLHIYHIQVVFFFFFFFFSVLAWRNYSQRSITPPKFYERFCVPLRLGANWGYWPSDSVFDQIQVVIFSKITNFH